MPFTVTHAELELLLASHIPCAGLFFKHLPWIEESLFGARPQTGMLSCAGRWRGGAVAVKVVPHSRRAGARVDALRESLLSSSIQHPNVVRIVPCPDHMCALVSLRCCGDPNNLLRPAVLGQQLANLPCDVRINSPGILWHVLWYARVIHFAVEQASLVDQTAMFMWLGR